MKTKLIFIPIFFFCNFSPVSEPEVKVEPVINIQKFDFDKPGAYPECYKDGDVVFYRANPPETFPKINITESYWIGVYKKKRGKMEFYRESLIGCSCIIDSVCYKWMNDSTIKFRYKSKDSYLNSQNHYLIIHSNTFPEYVPGTKEVF